MKIQDLQQPYRALAEMRREQQINSELFRKEVQYTKGFEKDSLLKNAFCWNVAREGSFWWYDLDNGKLPGIPAESLAELKEWQKEHPEYEATVIAEQPNDFDTPFNTKALSPQDEPNDKLFQAALAAMQGILAGALSKEGKIKTEEAANWAWDAAQDLINEGKKRGHL